jgi:uncharacterized protein YbaR (Trm112 family)
MENRAMLDPKLLDILVCPVTKGPLVYDRESNELISRSAKLAYPVVDGIPVLLEEEARLVEPE